jgi:hypothetical protein
MKTSFQWYDDAGRKYGLSVNRVAYLVHKHGLEKRKIYGCSAVNVEQWNDLIKELGFVTVDELRSKHADATTLQPSPELPDGL